MREREWKRERKRVGGKKSKKSGKCAIGGMEQMKERSRMEENRSREIEAERRETRGETETDRERESKRERVRATERDRERDRHRERHRERVTD